MAGVGFLQSLGEKADSGGRLALLGSDGECLRTASMEWNVPRKYGPHGELFFFLIQKEPATEHVGETFSPLFNADICTTRFSADVFKKCALFALHKIAEEGRDGFWVDEKKMGCPKSPTWEVKAKLGRRMKMRLLRPLVKAMCANDALHVVGFDGR